MHHKPDDYVRTLKKEVEKSQSSQSASENKSKKPTGKSSQSASGSKSKKATDKRRDVAQLGEQAKQSIAPLNVLSKDVSLAQQQHTEEAEKLAAVMGCIVAEFLGSQDDKLPTAAANPKPTYVPGKPLVSKEKWDQLPTQMRKLHQWYLSASKGDEIMIVENVPHDYYFRHDEVHVEFSELFQLFNFEALDKSLMSCYCL